MNVFFKIAHWVENKRPIKKLEFEQRIRPIEVSIQQILKVTQLLMERAGEEKAIRQELKVLRDKLGQ